MNASNPPSPGSPRGRITPEQRTTAKRLVQLVAAGPPSEAAIRELLAIASEPDGALRKVAVDVLSHLGHGDARIAGELVHLLECRLEPRFGGSIARALGRMGVASEPVLRVLVRARKVRVPGRGLRVWAKDALTQLGRPDLTYG